MKRNFLLPLLLLLLPAAAASAQQSGVRGKVVDAVTLEPLIEATVKVTQGGAGSALTDIDGEYTLPLPPGTYDLRVFYDVYQARKIQGVVVKPGELTGVRVTLSADAAAVQELVVEARSDRRNEQALLEDRRRSAISQDAVSAQEIARTPDSAASDAVKRVVSATVVDGKYVLLRGLGGKYTTTLLNGALLPSPEPDEPSVPLDIFPSNLLANLSVMKTYDPELPGQFGGGTLAVETNTFPTDLELRASISTGANTSTTFRLRPTQAATFGEQLGFASRRLPSDFPTDRIERLTPAQREAAGESLPNTWGFSRGTSLPSLGLNLSAGNSHTFAGGRKSGYLAALGFGRNEQRLLVTSAQAASTGTEVVEQNPATQELGTSTSLLSGLLNVGLLSENADHELSLLGLYTRGAELKSQLDRGVNMNEGDGAQAYAYTRQQFVARQLLFTQLKGSHRLGPAPVQKLTWQVNYSRVERDEPDTRDLVFYVDGDTRTFANRSNGKDRYFSTLGEDTAGATVNVGIPVTASLDAHAGALAQLSSRAFSLRRLQYNENKDDPVPQNLEAEEVFTPERIGTQLLFSEGTLNEDAYAASLAIFGGYATLDARLTERLRIKAGARMEVSSQQLGADSPYAPGGVRESQTRYQDLLPAANLSYVLSEKATLRGGYSYTLARPTFRELAPFFFYDSVRRRGVAGNPGLVESRLHNADLRLEYFPGEAEVLAFSVFAKQFENPIERVIANISAQDVTYKNTPAATLAGVEMEARLQLSRFTAALPGVRVGANLALTASRISLGANQGAQTSAQRPLQGTSPYVVNVSLGYARESWGSDFSLLYNVYGPRISDVGIQGLPDVYEQPFHRVDVAVSQALAKGLTLKLTAQNVLNSSVRVVQGPVQIQQYQPGVAFAAQLGWTL